MTETIDLAGRKVPVTNLDKVLWPKAGLTKGKLLQYYALLADVILPHWQNRPMTVTRYPHGVDDTFFYQKNCPSSAPEWVKTTLVNDVNYILVNDLSTLLWMVNQAAIEFHPAEYEISVPEHPSYAVIDLDPTAPLGFEAAVEVALHCREVLVKLSLRGYIKTSGATGLHIYIPIRPGYDFAITAGLAQMIGMLLRERLPDKITMERLIKNRHGVYVDFLQNAPGKTLVGVYSPRPSPMATVSAPVTWEELPYVRPEEFTIQTMPERVNRTGDLFAEVLVDKQSLDHILPVLADFGLDGR